LVGGDFGLDMEMVACSKTPIRKPVTTLREAAKLITEIYKIAHSASRRHGCYSVHKNWRIEAYNLLEKLRREDV